MNDSMAQPHLRLSPFELARWKTVANWTAAVLLALLFLSSGLWKITDVPGWAVRLAQARVPESLSVAGALVVGTAETVAGVFMLVPRLRRWGALLAGVLLVVFLAYFAINYGALRGQDCSCFPWLKRVVGPGFFIGDGAMLALAVAAWLWARRPAGVRPAVLIAGAVVVFALVSYGVDTVRQTGVAAPPSIIADGRPMEIGHGKFFLFFFNPMCTHCLDAAKRMSHLDWGDTQVVAIPVEQPQFSAQFLNETGLHAAVSREFSTLGRIFGYTAYPFGVAVVNGRERAAVMHFEGDEPAQTLRQIGFVH
jgi:uncharacterized membrane protein YphA (DoxX/SURF4 family)